MMLGIAEVLVIAFVLGVVLKPSFAEGVGHLLLAHSAAWRAAWVEYGRVYWNYGKPKEPALHQQRIGGR